MKNSEIIKLVEEIVHPYYTFEMDDFYGDRGGLPYPNIEDLDMLYFKKNGKDKSLRITKGEEQKMIDRIKDLNNIGSVELTEEHTMMDRIKDLNIGSVELSIIPSFGVYICIKVSAYDENNLFIIKNDDGICGMYTDLEKAKNELISIYKKTPDFKYYGYQIVVYKLLDSEYIVTNTIYTYHASGFSRIVLR